MTREISSRHVFYIPGFDPRGAGHYHRLYKAEAARQGHVNGLNFSVSPRRRLSDIAHAWDVEARTAGKSVKTKIEFLAWDDIIRRAWGRGMRSTFADMFLFLRDYIFCPTVFSVARYSPYQFIAGFYPTVYVLASCAIAGLLGSVVSSGIGGGLVGWIVGALAAFLAFKAALLLGERVAAFWLSRIYAFSARWARGEIKGIDERIDAFARRVIAAMQSSEVDEVVIVGHSVGAVIAVPLVAKVLRAAPPGKKLALLTLGHCIPLLSFHQQGGAYRQALQEIARDKRLVWADYTARPDGACFAQVDLVASAGIEPVPGAGPKILSPRFFKLYAPEKYKRLRYNWYRMHFLYLMSTDHAGDYDYFAMTAGPAPFIARFAGEKA